MVTLLREMLIVILALGGPLCAALPTGRISLVLTGEPHPQRRQASEKVKNVYAEFWQNASDFAKRGA
ncbi:MAG: hypothetical protein J5I92_16880 [Thiogranum sp.]|nr:hypothetical protein [Thiogranum sp.]